MADRSTYTDKLLSTSANFAICAGTVPLDIPHRRALVLHYIARDEFFFPKGHKDAGESVEAAAIRETEEETGYACVLQPHGLTTHATGLKIEEHTEPIAVQQRTRDGVRKVIFWYVASVREEDKGMQRLGEGEEFETVWVAWEELGSVLTFVDDREIGRVALEAVGGG